MTQQMSLPLVRPYDEARLAEPTTQQLSFLVDQS